MLSLSDLVTAKLPQSRSCPKLPAAYKLSRYIGKCAARVLKRSDLLNQNPDKESHVAA